MHSCEEYRHERFFCLPVVIFYGVSMFLKNTIMRYFFMLNFLLLGSFPVHAEEEVKTSEDSFNIKIKSLEERVNELKEKIFRSKARLMLLRETVLDGVISGAKANITHRNEMGGVFVLEQVAYSLDGSSIFSKVDVDGDLANREEFEVFNGNIVPGNHSISVYLVYRGHGYGIFSYLSGYKFRIRSSYSFTAEEGKLTSVKIVGFEKGGITTDLKDRPSVRFDVDVKKDVRKPVEQTNNQPAQ